MLNNSLFSKPYIRKSNSLKGAKTVQRFKIVLNCAQRTLVSPPGGGSVSPERVEDGERRLVAFAVRHDDGDPGVALL